MCARRSFLPSSRTSSPLPLVHLAVACGVAGDPYDAALVTSSDIPINETAARNWWFTCLGCFIIAPILYIIWAYCDHRGWLFTVKNAVPSVATSWMPSWLFGSSGGGSSSGGGYSASYKAVGASSTPISSAYGSA